MEGLFDAGAPSEQYAVRNVTGTLRSILTGLCYLATFLFGANAVGLTGLGLQVALGGDASTGGSGAGGATVAAKEEEEEKAAGGGAEPPL